MAILNKQLKTAENVYLEQNDIEKALNMYKSFHKWDEGKTKMVIHIFLYYGLGSEIY